MQLELISQEPVAETHRTPLLFIHGMWHGAWCWAEHFLPYFAQHGYNSHALSLRGHGKSEGREKLRWTSLNDFVVDVSQTVERFEHPPVLIGHSMGGMILQKYLETHQAPAAVLLASGPPRGLIPATLRVARRQPTSFLKANLTLSLYQVVGTPQLYKESHFSNGIPEQELAPYYNQVQDASYRAYLDMMVLNLPRPEKVKTPMLVLGTTDDYILTEKEVENTANSYNTDAAFFSGMGHAMMLDTGWEAVADRILEWLKEQDI
jgi:pimeloyl-ACP methyl ester carboxylesterase